MLVTYSGLAYPGFFTKPVEMLTILNSEEWLEIYREKQIYNCKFVAIIAHIRHNASGKIVLFYTELPVRLGEAEPSVFNWEENNYSCDCNRAMFFKQAQGIKDYRDGDSVACTFYQYSVNLQNPVTGKYIYSEFDHA